MAVFVDKNGHWAAFIPDLKEVDFIFLTGKNRSIIHKFTLRNGQKAASKEQMCSYYGVLSPPEDL